MAGGRGRDGRPGTRSFGSAAGCYLPSLSWTRNSVATLKTVNKGVTPACWPRLFAGRTGPRLEAPSALPTPPAPRPGPPARPRPRPSGLPLVRRGRGGVAHCGVWQRSGRWGGREGHVVFIARLQRGPAPRREPFVGWSVSALPTGSRAGLPGAGYWFEDPVRKT